MTSVPNAVEVRSLVNSYITDHLIRTKADSVYGVILGENRMVKEFTDESKLTECVIRHSYPVDDISDIANLKAVYNEHFSQKEVCVSYSYGRIKGIYCVTSSEEPTTEQCQNLSEIANECPGATILLHKNAVSGPLRAYILNEGELRHVEVSISSDDHAANQLFIRLSLATSPTYANDETLATYWKRIGTYNRHFAREMPWETYKAFASLRLNVKNYFSKESIESTLKTSRELRNEGKFDEAYCLIFKKLETYPDNYKLLMECGRMAIHLFEKKPMFAYRWFNKARMFAPDHAHSEIEGCINELVEPVDRALDSRMRKIHCLIKRYNVIPRSDPVLNANLKEMYYQSLYETLAIEGNKLTKQQMKQLVEQSRSKGPAIKDYNEVYGFRHAMCILEEFSQFQDGSITIENLTEAHRRILQLSDPDFAGILRPCEVTIGNLNPPKWTQVPDLMQGLVNFCNDQSQKLYPVDLAAAAHYQSLAIHGFADGNGRFSRLFQNVLLTRAGFPPLNVTVEGKRTYYDALARTHSAYLGDYRIFIDYVSEQMETALLKMIDIQKPREGGSRGAVKNMIQFESLLTKQVKHACSTQNYVDQVKKLCAISAKMGEQEFCLASVSKLEELQGASEELYQLISAQDAVEGLINSAANDFFEVSAIEAATKHDFVDEPSTSGAFNTNVMTPQKENCPVELPQIFARRGLNFNDTIKSLPTVPTHNICLDDSVEGMERMFPKVPRHKLGSSSSRRAFSEKSE